MTRPIVTIQMDDANWTLRLMLSRIYTMDLRPMDQKFPDVVLIRVFRLSVSQPLRTIGV